MKSMYNNGSQDGRNMSSQSLSCHTPQFNIHNINMVNASISVIPNKFLNQDVGAPRAQTWLFQQQDLSGQLFGQNGDTKMILPPAISHQVFDYISRSGLNSGLGGGNNHNDSPITRKPLLSQKLNVCKLLTVEEAFCKDIDVNDGEEQTEGQLIASSAVAKEYQIQQAQMAAQNANAERLQILHQQFNMESSNNIDDSDSSFGGYDRIQSQQMQIIDKRDKWSPQNNQRQGGIVPTTGLSANGYGGAGQMRLPHAGVPEIDTAGKSQMQEPPSRFEVSDHLELMSIQEKLHTTPILTGPINYQPPPEFQNSESQEDLGQNPNPGVANGAFIGGGQAAIQVIDASDDGDGEYAGGLVYQDDMDYELQRMEYFLQDSMDLKIDHLQNQPNFPEETPGGITDGAPQYSESNQQQYMRYLDVIRAENLINGEENQPVNGTISESAARQFETDSFFMAQF
ncbi:hypothetical protein FGO68_gene11184 [Halteria grandinella]|uniref:Uncharacterized protein n=1 Tax=Halteria grandinella TaxID=5974 RepID=A0A8J8T4N8_HALGN|nr:hypothetical protein FGO68_gene11184 [Halteria grandinella]